MAWAASASRSLQSSGYLLSSHHAAACHCDWAAFWITATFRATASASAASTASRHSSLSSQRVQVLGGIRRAERTQDRVLPARSISSARRSVSGVRDSGLPIPQASQYCTSTPRSSRAVRADSGACFG